MKRSCDVAPESVDDPMGVSKRILGRWFCVVNDEEGVTIAFRLLMVDDNISGKKKW
jgi:hypothetical protein